MSHFGRLVEEDGGQLLLKTLKDNNVDTSLIKSNNKNIASDAENTASGSLPRRRTGRAIIQVQQADGDNAIVLLPGENHAITADDVATHIPWSRYSALLLQNETSHVDTLIKTARDHKLQVFFK